MAQISISLGRVTITQDAESLKDAIKKSIFLQQIPDKCPKCGSALEFNYYAPKTTGGRTVEYFGVRCTGKVIHSLNFHEYTDNKGFYIKADDKWTTYVPQSAETNDDAPSDFEQEAKSLVRKVSQHPKDKGTYVVGEAVIRVWTDEDKKKHRSCDCAPFQKNPNQECVHLRALWYKYSPDAPKQA